MRGSREISLVPSLHRASTDALIPVENAKQHVHAELIPLTGVAYSGYLIRQSPQSSPWYQD